MPPPRRRARLRRPDLGELTRFQRRHLEQGHPLLLWEGYASREEFAEGWAAHGEAILAEWIENHPGTRPFAWWLITHGQERPAVNPARPGLDSPYWRQTTFGFLHTHTWPGLQEDETSYLRRMGLLTPAELEALDESVSEEPS